MRKTIALCMALLMLLAGCGKQKVDIPVDQLDWELYETTVDGESYAVLDVTNNSQYTLSSVRVEFFGREDLTGEETSRFYEAIRQSQGFSESFMQDYIRTMEDNRRPLTLQGQSTAPLTPGESAVQLKCYYMGGWTSRNVHCADLFAVGTVTLEYEKNGVAYTLTYDYADDAYTCRETAQQQP